MADAIEQGLASWDDDKGEWFLAVPIGCETNGDRPERLPSALRPTLIPWVQGGCTAPAKRPQN
jgi:hypothetical protein